MIKQRDIDQAYSDYKHQFGGRKEDYFALCYLCKEFNKSPEEIYQQIAFGGNDYGIDAFLIHPEKRNLYLYQFKWSENHWLFRESLERIIESGIDIVFGKGSNSLKQNDIITNLKSQIWENQTVIDRVLVRMVFDGEVSKADENKMLDYYREKLEDKNYIIKEFFGRDVELRVQFYSNQDGLGHLPPSPKPDYEVDFECSAEFKSSSGDILYTGLLRLIDLYRIYSVMKERFFERNIRFGYSPDKPPNRAIRDTLKKIVVEEKENPEIFIFKHNGISMSVQDLIRNESKTTLIHPRLLNGAQTVTSLVKFIEDYKENPAYQKNKALLEEIKILAKIVKTNSDEFIVNITICNNKQNPVHPWNLRANDSIQILLQEKFREELKIFYERQENSFEHLTSEDLEEMGIEHDNAIEIKKLAQTFLAVQGEISKMSNLPKVFEEQKAYENTFKKSFAQGDLRKIVLAYKVQPMIKGIIKEISESKQYAYFEKARNLVWALLIQAILNHGDLSSLLEKYGNSLKKELNFRDELKQLTANKVKLILKKAIEDANKQEDVRSEKYDFLKSSEFYKVCMNVAYEKFRWTKKSF